MFFEIPPPANFDPTLNSYWTLFNLGVTGIFLVLLLIGKVRAEREVVREKEIGDGKEVIISGALKDQTDALNRLADGILERNRIELEMRGRRA